MKIDNIEETAMILRILGDKTRLSMLKLMQLKDCCVCEFVEIFKMSQPAISQHMRRLYVLLTSSGCFASYSKPREKTSLVRATRISNIM